MTKMPSARELFILHVVVIAASMYSGSSELAGQSPQKIQPGSNECSAQPAPAPATSCAPNRASSNVGIRIFIPPRKYTCWFDPQDAKSNEEYLSERDAATAALTSIDDESRIADIEFGGTIYKKANGRFAYTGPRTEYDASTVNPLVGCGPGVPVAYYHTHGDAKRCVDWFSWTDVVFGFSKKLNGYLLTPGNYFYEYRWKEDKLYVEEVATGKKVEFVTGETEEIYDEKVKYHQSGMLVDFSKC